MQQCSISKERKMIDRLSKIITTPRGRTKRPSSIPSSIVGSWTYFEYYESHRLTRSIFPTFMENFHKKIIFIPWNETMNISLFTQWIYSFLPSQYSLSPKRRANITSPHILLNIHFLFPSFFLSFPRLVLFAFHGEKYRRIIRQLSQRKCDSRGHRD